MHICWFYDGVFLDGVVVYEVRPSYYAGGPQTPSFDLIGWNFNSLPEGAVGTLAFNNASPLSYRSTTNASRVFRVEVLDDARARALVSDWREHEYPGAFYLGCIVSSDREQLYWVNNSSPL